MCGVAGYFGNGVAPAEAKALLARMASKLSHRGPDDSGIHVDGEAGLTHRRLSIVGLSDGHQPMSDAPENLVISYNGEIFNYVELRNELIARGRKFRTQSDTEVILHLYAEKGLDCLHDLNGDFAFALWDTRQRCMVLARDRMGVRPLFHTQRGDTLFFASEIKALLTVPGIEASLDPFALDQIFTLWAPLAPRTAFQGISELPPGHLMIVKEGRIDQRVWWRQSYPDAGHVRPRPDAVEELRALLDDATRIRLRADVPVGSYLSGGLDSSLVSTFAARAQPERLSTFSLGFDSEEHDESRWQALMATALGVEHTTVRCTAGDISQLFPSVIRHVERPILRTAPAPLAKLSALVHENGIKAVLTGEGADELFAGYDIFREASCVASAVASPIRNGGRCSSGGSIPICLACSGNRRNIWPASSAPGTIVSTISSIHIGRASVRRVQPSCSSRPNSSGNSAIMMQPRNLLPCCRRTFPAGIHCTRLNIWKRRSCCRATSSPPRATGS